MTGLLKRQIWNEILSNDYQVTQGFYSGLKEYSILADRYTLLKKLHDSKTIVISGFPGVGKSFVFNNQKRGSVVLDSDSSKFDKNFFPENYIKHIKDNIGKVDIIFVSSHKIVRDALVKEDIPFVLVYPSIFLKDEYIYRYMVRDNDDNFIKFISDNWDKFITDLSEQEGCYSIELQQGQFLKDVI